MSFDIFLQHFRNGEPATFKRSIVDEIFGPYDDNPQPDFMRVRFPDGSGSDMYLEEEDIQCIMFNHCGGDAFFAALYELAARTQSIIFWPDTGPATVVTDKATLQHLPPDFPGNMGPARIAHSGAELEKCIFG